MTAEHVFFFAPIKSYALLESQSKTNNIIAYEFLIFPNFFL